MKVMNPPLDPKNPVIHLAAYNVLGDRYVEPSLSGS